MRFLKTRKHFVATLNAKSYSALDHGSSVFSVFDDRLRNVTNSGYFIGLLGSPDWETRFDNIAIHGEGEKSFTPTSTSSSSGLANISSTTSRSYQSQVSTNVNTPQIVASAPNRPSIRFSDIPTEFGQRAKKTKSLTLPARSTIARLDDSTPLRRRFTLPARCFAVYSRHMNGKRQGSPKERPEISHPFWLPPKNSLPLKPHTTTFDLSLPIAGLPRLDEKVALSSILRYPKAPEFSDFVYAEKARDPALLNLGTRTLFPASDPLPMPKRRSTTYVVGSPRLRKSSSLIPSKSLPNIRQESVLATPPANESQLSPVYEGFHAFSVFQMEQSRKSVSFFPSPSPLRFSFIPEEEPVPESPIPTIDSNLTNTGTTHDDPLGTVDSADTSGSSTARSHECQGGQCGHRLFQRKSDDPEALLSLIEELVEETKSWDADIFKDPGFVSLIEASIAGKSSASATFPRIRAMKKVEDDAWSVGVAC